MIKANIYTVVVSCSHAPHKRLLCGNYVSVVHTFRIQCYTGIGVTKCFAVAVHSYVSCDSFLHFAHCLIITLHLLA